MLLKLYFRRCLFILLFAIIPPFVSAAVAQSLPKKQSVDTDLLLRWLNRSIETHPQVLAARAALDAANYRTVAADKALYNPELELDAENAETRVRSIGLSQKIDWGDIRGARTKMATAQKLAARFKLESIRRDVAAKLLDALAEYHTDLSLKALAGQTKQLMQRFATLAKRRFEAGDISQVEVDLANLAYAQASFKLADAMTKLAHARQNLIILTGTGNAHLPDFISSFPDPQASQQNIEQTIQQLPQIQSLLARIAASRQKVNVRRGEATAKPTIAIRAGNENQDSLLGVSLSIPLQVRNNFNAEVDVANAQMIQLEAESQASFRKLKARLNIARLSYAVSRRAWLAWQASAAGSLNRQITLLERLWKAGELSTTDYLVQLKQALETRASAIQQRGQMWTNWSAWLLASGKIKHWLQTSTNKE